MTPAALLTPTRLHKYGVKNHLTEVYPGVVEYNVDPRKLGRVKVRIPNLHSTEAQVTTEELPWARPFGSFGGFHGGGCFTVPPVGATVYVLFLMGDPQYPVYGGSWNKEPDVPRETLSKTSSVTGRGVGDRPVSMGRWMAPAGPEVLPEVLATPYEPTAYVTFQSPKGANTGFVQDRDAFEETSFRDRGGQALVLSSPVTDERNSGNAGRRGQGSATDGTGVGYGDLAGGASTIELRGVGGQGIRIHSAPDSEYVEITSKDASGPAMPSSGDGGRVSLRIGGGAGTFEVEGVVGGQIGFRLSMDAGTGAVILEAGSDLTIRADSTRLLGDVEVSGTLIVGGDLHVSGEV